MAVHPRVLFVLTLTNGRPLVAGHGTAADAMIGLAGGTNVATGFDGYKAMTDEAIVAAAPEVVVSMRDGPGNLTADDVFQSPAFSTTPAALRRRFVALDGAGLLAFGPRTPSIARELMERLSR